MVSSVDGSNWIETFFHQQESIKRMLSPAVPMLGTHQCVLIWFPIWLLRLTWRKEGGKDGKYGSWYLPGRHCRCQQTELFQPKQCKLFLVLWILGTTLVLDETHVILGTCTVSWASMTFCLSLLQESDTLLLCICVLFLASFEVQWNFIKLKKS